MVDGPHVNTSRYKDWAATGPEGSQPLRDVPGLLRRHLDGVRVVGQRAQEDEASDFLSVSVQSAELE